MDRPDQRAVPCPLCAPDFVRVSNRSLLSYKGSAQESAAPNGGDGDDLG